jgi:hypothetical protein
MSTGHVESARRRTSDALRAFAEKETSALLTGELARRQEEWRGALGSVKQTLVDLGASCDALMGAAPDPPTKAVSDLIEKIVAAAAAEADAIVQQMEAEAQASAADAQTLFDRLQAEIQAGREQLRTAHGQLQLAHDARTRAEAATKEAQAARERAVSGFETQVGKLEDEIRTNRAELAALQQRLNSAQAERANLMATLEAVQSAVHRAVSTIPAPISPPAAPHRNAQGEPSVVAVPSAHVVAPSSSTRRQPAAGSPEVPADVRAGVGDYARALLDTVEAMYGEDVASRLPQPATLERLRANLNHARDLFTERLGPDQAHEASVFIDQMTTLLDTKSTTPFGRDLAIACETERHGRRHANAAPHVPGKTSV